MGRKHPASLRGHELAVDVRLSDAITEKSAAGKKAGWEGKRRPDDTVILQEHDQRTPADHGNDQESCMSPA